MFNIIFKNVDLINKWWIELIKTINYFRNHFSIIDKSIIYYEIDTKKKSFFAHFRWIKTIDYVMKRKSITKWKKLISKSFSIMFVKYEKNHIYQIMRFKEIIYHVSFVIWIKKKREESLVEIANEISTKRLIMKLIESSTKKQVLELNSIIKSSTKKKALKSNSIIIFMFSS
jgi:hypothetical protein